MLSEGNKRILLVKDLAMDDTAEYSCTIGSEKTTTNLEVQGIPYNFKLHLHIVLEFFIPNHITFVTKNLSVTKLSKRMNRQHFKLQIPKNTALLSGILTVKNWILMNMLKLSQLSMLFNV